MAALERENVSLKNQLSGHSPPDTVSSSSNSISNSKRKSLYASDNESNPAGVDNKVSFRKLSEAVEHPTGPFLTDSLSSLYPPTISRDVYRLLMRFLQRWRHIGGSMEWRHLMTFESQMRILERPL